MTLLLQDTHPVVACLDAIDAALDELDTRAWEGLAPSEARAETARLGRITARLEAQRFAAVRALEKTNAARDAGATSTGDLLAKDFGGDRRAGDRLVRRAERLESATQTEAALAAGKVTADQADVIASGLAKLPETATPDQRSLAERTC